MTLPRALCGPVRAMARPARPPAEIAAVKAAAAIVRAETGQTAAEPVARMVASQVADACMKHIKNGANEPFAEALSALGRQMFSTPICVLATCPDIDTLSIFVDERMALLEARNGRAIDVAEERREVSLASKELKRRLAGRYVRLIRRQVSQVLK